MLAYWLGTLTRPYDTALLPPVPRRSRVSPDMRACAYPLWGACVWTARRLSRCSYCVGRSCRRLGPRQARLPPKIALDQGDPAVPCTSTGGRSPRQREGGAIRMSRPVATGCWGFAPEGLGGVSRPALPQPHNQDYAGPRQTCQVRPVSPFSASMISGTYRGGSSGGTLRGSESGL